MTNEFYSRADGQLVRLERFQSARHYRFPYFALGVVATVLILSLMGVIQ